MLKDFYYKLSNVFIFYRKEVSFLTSKERISVFTGGFGSGKTENALNYALSLKDQGKMVTIVDLDLINPYFRVRAVRKSLESKGIKVVSPEGKFSVADVPALPAAIYGIFEGEGHAVIDVGGDDIGAIALGRFREQINARPCNIFFVVNTCRPNTRDESSIIKMMRGIEKTSRLQVNALICNTNLGRRTDAGIVLGGYKIIAEVAEKSSLPVAYIAARRELAGQLGSPGVPVRPIDLFMKPPWED
jgi:hypothetical protein